MTERLIDDRNLDDFREVLRTTAGVTFLAGETGEEDVRLRGFSLGQAGDIYVDGLRDAPLIERDTFNHDRVEVLKGSASMLFGKGSTGGVVNQVSKQPFLMDQHEVNYTVGTGQEHRLTGDFNLKTGEDSALRINAMAQNADNTAPGQQEAASRPPTAGASACATSSRSACTTWRPTATRSTTTPGSLVNGASSPRCRPKTSTAWPATT
jgi:catecholate siderophore receptor